LAGKVTEGLVESNGSLPPASAQCQTLVIEYGTALITENGIFTPPRNDRWQ